MRSSFRFVALLSFATASTLAAQSPGAQARGDRAPAAKLLLANTAELDLTDGQVLRLAAIARRSEARRRGLRASMDSVRARFAPGRATPADSVARRQTRDRMMTEMDRLREQHRVDQRDAIAVLTPDQQARAWDLVASRGGGRAMGGRQMRRGPGMRGFRGSERRPRMPRPPREG